MNALKEIWPDINIKIIRATNGLEAAEICKTQHIDIMLMDIKMPIMNGYEATRQIRQIKPNLPIIAQTAYTDGIDKKNAFACGCTDFISKPINKELFISKINKNLTN